jgi:integrase
MEPERTPDSAREPQTPLDLDRLLAMTTKWPKYPEREHKSGRARLTIGRKSLYLRGPWGSEESRDHYDELHKRWRLARRNGGQSAPVPASLTVADAVATYLDWSSLHQAPSTTYGYRWYGNAFAALHGDHLAVELPRYYVTRWVDEMVSSGRWTSPNTMASAVAALARIFSWCTEEGLLKANPLAGMKPGKRRSRQRVLTDAEYRALLRGAHPAFRRILVALRWTGARPCELRAATWADVQYGDDGRPARIVLAKHKTATTAKTPRPRVIWLVGPMPRLITWLRRHGEGKPAHGRSQGKCQAAQQVTSESVSKQAISVPRDFAMETGVDHVLGLSQHMFLTETGRPWSAGRLCQVVGERRRAAGLADGVISYGLRHAFGTSAVMSGLDLKTISTLMGNSPKVVSEVYCHIDSEHAYLQEKMQQAVKSRGKAS